MKNIDLSIIIVNFNTADLTVACLKSVYDHVKEISFEVIVVDNASKDESINKIQNAKLKIQNYNSKVKIIENKENVGFSRANNIGVKESSGRYVLFLNSDTVVPEKTAEYMVHFMDSHSDAGAATCFVRLANGELDDAAHRGFPTPWNALCHFSGLSKLFPNTMLFNGYHMGWCHLNKTHEIDALAGAFMIVRREAGEQVKWWDEDYFFYGEDIDFCYMLKQNGPSAHSGVSGQAGSGQAWKIYFVPEVEILHLKGASSGIRKESQKMTTASLETKRWVTNQRFNAMKTFYRKHYKDKYPRFLTASIMMVIDLRLKKTLSSLS